MKRLLRDSFGDMPSKRVIIARLLLLGVLTGMCVVFLLLMVAWEWFATWVIADPGHAARVTVSWILGTLGYVLFVRWLCRRLGDASDQLEERQDYLARLRKDLDTATYIDSVGQHPVREWDDEAFSLDFPHDNAVESPDTRRAA